MVKKTQQQIDAEARDDALFDSEFKDGLVAVCRKEHGVKDFEVHIPDGGPRRLGAMVGALLTQGWSQVTVRAGRIDVGDANVHLVLADATKVVDGSLSAADIDDEFDNLAKVHPGRDAVHDMSPGDQQ